MHEGKLCLMQHKQQDSYHYSTHYSNHHIHHQQPHAQCITNHHVTQHTTTSLPNQLESPRLEHLDLYSYQVSLQATTDSTTYNRDTLVTQSNQQTLSSSSSSSEVVEYQQWLNNHEQSINSNIMHHPNYITSHQPNKSTVPSNNFSNETLEQVIGAGERQDYSNEPSTSGTVIHENHHSSLPQIAPPNKINQRVKANKKERRRTQSINQAFSELRKHIPDVPADTKLSKIKTLRLAISYISHLMSTLENDDQSNQHQHLRLEHQKSKVQSSTCKTASNNIRLSISNNTNQTYLIHPPLQATPAVQFSSTTLLAMNKQFDKSMPKSRKHRTGWPEIVWTLSSGLKRLDPVHLGGT